MAKPTTEKESTRERKVIKVKVEKNEYDELYPYIIKDAWGGTIYCDKKDLINLKKDIKKILDK